MQTSPRGRAFISAHEGNPLTAYLDPAGVPTIGHGFTMRSPAVRKEFAKLGITALKPGKTKITAAQSDAIFEAVLRDEFAPAVTRALPPGRIVTQHMFDAMSSATYNLGPAFMEWRWKTPWAEKNDVRGAARIWADNYNTAAGKKLPGLVRRRREEAALFEHGVYAGTPAVKDVTETKPALQDPDVREAQEALNKVGLPVKVDGWMGPKTRAAILAYQKMHPHLANDGVLGPATLAQLRRDVMAVKDVAQKGGSLIAGSGLVSAVAGLPWLWIAAGVAIVAAGYFAWRYRDVVQRRWNKLRGKEVTV